MSGNFVYPGYYGKRVPPGQLIISRIGESERNKIFRPMTQHGITKHHVHRHRLLSPCILQTYIDGVKIHYVMISPLTNQIPFISHLFSIYTAPEYQLVPALEHTLTRHTGTVLYLSGNYPLILHNLRRYENRFDIRIVTTGLQALKILDENRYDLVLFEHDRSLYENTADLLRPIGRACRKNSSEQRTVALFSTRQDGWLKRMEEFAHRSISIEQANAPKMSGNRRIQFIPSQRTLDTVW